MITMHDMRSLWILILIYILFLAGTIYLIKSDTRSQIYRIEKTVDELLLIKSDHIIRAEEHDRYVREKFASADAKLDAINAKMDSYYAQTICAFNKDQCGRNVKK